MLIPLLLPLSFFFSFFDPTFLFSETFSHCKATHQTRAQVLLLQTWFHAQEWLCALSGPAVIAAGLCRLNPPPGASGLQASFAPSSILQPAWLCAHTHPCSSKDWLCNHRAGLAKDILLLLNHQSCDLKKSASGDFPKHSAMRQARSREWKDSHRGPTGSFHRHRETSHCSQETAPTFYRVWAKVQVMKVT